MILLHYFDQYLLKELSPLCHNNQLNIAAKYILETLSESYLNLLRTEIEKSIIKTLIKERCDWEKHGSIFCQILDSFNPKLNFFSQKLNILIIMAISMSKTDPLNSGLIEQKTFEQKDKRINIASYDIIAKYLCNQFFNHQLIIPYLYAELFKEI